MSTLALGAIPANLLQVVLREFEMLLQNNLATDMHRAARYVQFISLLKEEDNLEQKEAKRILEEVRKLLLVLEGSQISWKSRARRTGEKP